MVQFMQYAIMSKLKLLLYWRLYGINYRKNISNYGRKAKTIWINGIYIGNNNNWCNFDLGDGKEVSIDADDVDKKVRELKE